MKTLFWFLVSAILTGLAFGFVVSPWYPKNPIVVSLIVAFFGAPSIGALWMLYMAIRYEKHPLGTILLAFLPYTFLWYYFERVRPRRAMHRESGSVA